MTRRGTDGRTEEMSFDDMAAPSDHEYFQASLRTIGRDRFELALTAETCLKNSKEVQLRSFPNIQTSVRGRSGHFRLSSCGGPIRSHALTAQIQLVQWAIGYCIFFTSRDSPRISCLPRFYDGIFAKILLLIGSRKFRALVSQYDKASGAIPR